jgi:hypothetical protein
MNLYDNENPSRKITDYRQVKLNSVGYPIGLLPDDPSKLHLVGEDTNWEHVPPTLILDALTRALENASDQLPPP